MKVWLKTVLAAAVGLVIGILLSRGGGGEVADLLPRLSRVALQIGRYAVFPAVFFGVVMSTHELRSNAAAPRLYGRLALYVAGSSALLTVAGLASVLLLAPQRIPIVVIVDQAPHTPAGLIDVVAGTFPANMFQALVGDGSMLLPLPGARARVRGASRIRRRGQAPGDRTVRVAVPHLLPDQRPGGGAVLDGDRGDRGGRRRCGSARPTWRSTAS